MKYTTSACAICAGLVLGLAVLGIINIAFEILALAIIVGLTERSKTSTAALYIGLLFGLAFFFVAYWPVSTAGNWTGWSLVPQNGATNSEPTSNFSVDYLLLTLLCIFSCLSAATIGISCAIANIVRRNSHIAFFYLAFFLSWLLLVEEFRSRFILGGYYLINIGNPLVNFLEFSQLASFGGVTALSGLILIFSFIIYELYCYRRITIRTVAFLAIAMIVYAYGNHRINTLNKGSHSEISAVAIQEHITNPAGSRPTREDYNEHWMSNRYLSALSNEISNTLPNTGQSLIVLPESIGFGTVSIDGSVSSQSPERTLSDISDWDASVSQLFSDQRFIVVLGSDTTEKRNDYNSLIVWDSVGQLSRYHKRKLVPFAEYTPSFLKNNELFASRIGYNSGQGFQTRDFEGFRLSFFICQETLFPFLVYSTVVESDANLIVVAGNDGVFESELMNRLNHTQARLRAIEVGRDMVRSMKTGTSSLITADGRILERVEFNEAGTAKGLLQLRSANTIYSRRPFLFTYLLLLLALFMTIGVALTMNKTSVEK